VTYPDGTSTTVEVAIEVKAALAAASSTPTSPSPSVLSSTGVDHNIIWFALLSLILTIGGITLARHHR
ncbi:MAG: hypothetical protein WBH82_06750, partial [Arcanobacterium sp.]